MLLYIVVNNILHHSQEKTYYIIEIERVQFRCTLQRTSLFNVGHRFNMWKHFRSNAALLAYNLTPVGSELNMFVLSLAFVHNQTLSHCMLRKQVVSSSHSAIRSGAFPQWRCLRLYSSLAIETNPMF